MDEIILDTSSILFSLSNKNDIFKRVEEQLDMKPVVSKGIVRELKKIAGSMKGQSKYAAVALQLIEKYAVKVDESNDYPDKWISNQSSTVCTNDAKLKKELRAKGIQAYTISKNGTLR